MQDPGGTDVLFSSPPVCCLSLDQNLCGGDCIDHLAATSIWENETHQTKVTVFSLSVQNYCSW